MPSPQPVSHQKQQSSSRLLMIRPACFTFNLETAISNAFQNKTYASANEELQQQALTEFNTMIQQIKDLGIHVDVIDDTNTPVKPDAIFPNNWISTHSDGTIILYPMLAESRRLERRKDIVDQLCKMYYVTAIIDLSCFEKRNMFLEGTGSLVLDRQNGLAYAIRSPRTHEQPLKKFEQLTGYKVILFDSVDQDNRPIYHTNVMMTIGTNIAIICLSSIIDENQRSEVVNWLKQTNKIIVDITFEQMNKNFAGNMLEICNDDGKKYLAMSKCAFQSLNEEQIKIITQQENLTIVNFDINTIEQCGGGSVRCMIAENFLI
ncbi:unnamed protein product [Didymodactylos carnosus]|uniref:Amidinotransferase n=1 Tax=Didymodactylos carnosus TaxID=1234261 RepID=A0A813XRM9_9BILA|nr:unnamed protein product [Didymodactylos carnosus]CAF1414791.1 unnamed protein product [Didymodactylos carnosus]CAF3656537.1 unnamed protein product [Didymodactylos carnosus]CAF4217591.1 unnamed protein product [Didymodactylos carnosus]